MTAQQNATLAASVKVLTLSFTRASVGAHRCATLIERIRARSFHRDDRA